MGDEEPCLQLVLPRVPYPVERRDDHRDVGHRVPELSHVHRHLSHQARHSVFYRQRNRWALDRLNLVKKLKGLDYIYDEA